MVLQHSEKVPGEVKCDVHKWMDGVLMVRDNPYVAITDAQGKFQIENIPAGEWKETRKLLIFMWKALGMALLLIYIIFLVSELTA